MGSLRNISLFVTAHINRGVTRYERGGERRCTSIDGDLGRSVVRSSGLLLEPSGQGRPRIGKDIREVGSQNGGR